MKSSPRTFSAKPLSYERHDGHELRLMLAGSKPLTLLYDDAAADSQPAEWDAFEDRVRSGDFEKGEYIVEGSTDPRTGQPARIRYVLYATKNEAWRIPAMILVLKTMRLSRDLPSEGLDRMVGSLLGYSDTQNDEYISSGDYPRSSL